MQAQWPHQKVCHKKAWTAIMLHTLSPMQAEVKCTDLSNVRYKSTCTAAKIEWRLFRWGREKSAPGPALPGIRVVKDDQQGYRAEKISHLRPHVFALVAALVRSENGGDAILQKFSYVGIWTGLSQVWSYIWSLPSAVHSARQNAIADFVTLNISVALLIVNKPSQMFYYYLKTIWQTV